VRYWEAGRRHSWDLPQEFHYTTWTGERTIAQIDESVRQNKPFFVWSSFHDPHPPYLVPEPWASMYDPKDMKIGTMIPGELDRMPPHHRLTQEESPDFSAWQETPHPNHGFHSHTFEEAELKKDVAVYYGMISFMDQQIGRILKRLDDLGIAENTLVVFSTDHGHFFGHHGLIAKGAFHYEDLLRVPFIVRCPGAKLPGQSSHALQALIDLAPTFLTAAKIPVPGSMQGVNQLPTWLGEHDQARDEVIVENRHQPSAVHLRTYITDRYKITVYRDREYGELFDLQNDPEERRNLWDDPAAAQVKCDLMKRFINAELRREPTRFARIAGA
jgi:arylsulfatase A-like enzyme